MVVVISVEAYPFFAVSGRTCHLENMEEWVFSGLHCVC